MKTNKRLISLLLTLALVLSCLPGIALLAAAEEIAKPQGISIVQDFDRYSPKKYEDGKLVSDWNDAILAALPAGEWERPAKYVDPSVTGFYSIPGTVDGKATSVTVEVREKNNLFDAYYGGFNEANAATIKDNYTKWYFRGTAAMVTEPVYEGSHAVKVTVGADLTSSFQLAILATSTAYNEGINAAIAAAMAANPGKYFFGIQGRWDEDKTPSRIAATLNYSTKDKPTTGTKFVSAQSPLLSKDSYAASYGVFDLTEELASTLAGVMFWVQYTPRADEDGVTESCKDDVVYFDCAELLNIDILPLDEEPAAISKITDDAFDAIAVVENYDSYFENWKTALDLPATVAIEGSDGTAAEANISWNYTGLNLAKPGKYTLTGKLVSEKYVNTDALTVQQVILVRPASNLLEGGDFENGNGGFNQYRWNMSNIEDPLNAGNKVAFVTRDPLTSDGGTLGVPTGNSSVAIAPANKDPNGQLQLLAKMTAGQYAMQIKVMAAAYNEDNAAREDLSVNFVLRCYKEDGTRDDKTYTGSYKMSTTEWTTYTYITEVDPSLYAKGVRPDVFVVSPQNQGGKAGAFYADDFELILLKTTLAAVADCEHAACEQTVVDPTCGTAGYTYNLCTACGHSFNSDEVEATGEHNYVDGVCDVCGAKDTPACEHQYFYPCDPVCMICNEITNPDAAHNIVAVEAKAATCTENGNVAYWYCSDCGTAWTDEAQTQLTNLRNVVIPATGEHTYDNDSDADCNVCGETREVGPIADSALKFMQAPSLSFQDYIGMQVLMTKKLANNYDKVYVEAVQVTPEGEVTTILNPITYLTNYYVFDQQIMAWSMTETVTLTLYAEKDGKTYVGQTYTQSVESLALAMMEKYSTNTTICRMLVDMLNYGAAVQTQFSHNAESLPNTQLGDFAAMGSTNIPECDAANTKTGTATVKVINDSVSMQAKVEIQLVIKGAVTATPKATIGTTVLNPVLDTTSIKGYTVIRVAVGATQLRETVTIALYDENDAPVTQVYNVSVEGYAVTAITGSQKDVVIAMMRYGDSVTAYANK